MVEPQRKKRVLFVSGSDFKEKSIQVIRKTPEAYYYAGWDVHYVVGRDNSKSGDYFYEKVVNPQGINVYRFVLPLEGVHAWVNHDAWKALWFRIRTTLLVLMLAWKARRVIRNTGEFDVIYGYEVPGVLAARLLRFSGLATSAAFVTRFQGVLHVKEWLRRGQQFRKLTNWEAVMALRTKSDLTIMTNDGSQGLDVLRSLHAPANKVLFYVNGVDKPTLDQNVISNVRSKYYALNTFHFLSVSRLDAHKRLDRGIRVIHSLIKKFKIENIRYTIIGGGVEYESLKKLIAQLELEDYVLLAGPVNHSEVHYHMYLCDALISMYTSSNVGNPLLEAIRHNKPVITLNNGDTGAWIQHFKNGLIYQVDDGKDLSPKDYELIADDVQRMVKDSNFLQALKANMHITEQQKLWTWDERLHAEVTEVTQIVNTHGKC